MHLKANEAAVHEVAASDVTPALGHAAGHDAAAERRAEALWAMAPALLPLLIMPLGILFHPTWLVPLAEFGTLVLFITILRLMRL